MKAYLFDVDGVLADPQEKQVTENELFYEFIKRLKRGDIICLNTGRSTKWMVERIISPFLERIEDKALLKNFIAIGEKGNTEVKFDTKGNMIHKKMSEDMIPMEVIEEVKVLVKDKYSDSMFFDDTKETMISVEMHDGFEIDEYHKIREFFVKDLTRILQAKDLLNKYKIDPSNLSTDVEGLHTGKNLGAEYFLSFLSENHIEPKEFDAFGDSESDFAMTDTLFQKGKDAKMIYVGDKSKLGEMQKGYSVEYIGNFTKGTLAYLQTEYTV